VVACPSVSVFGDGDDPHREVGLRRAVRGGASVGPLGLGARRRGGHRPPGSAQPELGRRPRGGRRAPLGLGRRHALGERPRPADECLSSTAPGDQRALRLHRSSALRRGHPRLLGRLGGRGVRCWAVAGDALAGAWCGRVVVGVRAERPRGETWPAGQRALAGRALRLTRATDAARAGGRRRVVALRRRAGRAGAPRRALDGASAVGRHLPGPRPARAGPAARRPRQVAPC